MEKITLEELNKRKKELEEEKVRIKELDSIIKVLKSEDIVKKYIDADTKHAQSKNKIESLQEQIKYQNMLHCDHYFVVNDIVSDFDGHRTDRTEIITCIHCGLTNKFMNQYFWKDVSKSVQMMNQIFLDNNCYYWPRYGNCSYEEITELKRIYDQFMDEYPKATDEDIENQIALVKKMRGGKLC